MTKPCPRCNGTGRTRCQHCDTPQARTCPICDAKGFVYRQRSFGSFAFVKFLWENFEKIESLEGDRQLYYLLANGFLRKKPGRAEQRDALDIALNKVRAWRKEDANPIPVKRDKNSSSSSQKKI